MKKILAKLCKHKLLPRKFHYDIYRICKGHSILLSRKLAFSDIKMLLNIGDYIHFWMYVEGGYELPFLKFLHNHLPQGGTFIDAGANVGSYTLNLATKMNLVIAIEACKNNASIIQATCALNNINNVQIYNNALSKIDDEIIDLYISNNTCGSNSLYIRNESNKKESVKTITIDTICIKNSIKDVQFIKIDIEGAEYDCLQGAIKIIERDNPLILCEFNSSAASLAGYNLTALYNFLIERTYSPFILDERKMKLIGFDKKELNNNSFQKNIFFVHKNKKIR
jgi:FkbM family methyltransferase